MRGSASGQGGVLLLQRSVPDVRRRRACNPRRSPGFSRARRDRCRHRI